jgi:hypothetical protein
MEQHSACDHHPRALIGTPLYCDQGYAAGGFQSSFSSDAWECNAPESSCSLATSNAPHSRTLSTFILEKARLVDRDPEPNMDNARPTIDLQEEYSSLQNDSLNGAYVPPQHPMEKDIEKDVSGVDASLARPSTHLATPKRRATTRQAQGSVPENKSPGFLNTFFRASSSRPPKHTYVDHGRDGCISEYENEVSRMSEYIHRKELEWKEYERKLLSKYQQKTSDHNKAVSDLQAKLHESETEKHQIEENHIASVRKHQEAWFKHRDKARWPAEAEGDITHKLDTLKRSMRSWARDISVTDLSKLSSLMATEYSALMQELAQVVLVENNELPPGLSTAARSPMLLLNALLAHTVYLSYFQSPFFSFKDIDTDHSDIATQDKLESIYQQAKECWLALLCKRTC